MKRISPPTLYKLLIVFMLGTLLLPVQRKIIFPYNLLGILPSIFGIYMAIKSKQLFKQTRTPMHPFTNPTQLHQVGFFRYSRNPMYLGITVGLLGIGMLTGHVFNLAFSVLYIILCDFWYVRFEEKELQKKFGAKFKEYKLKTRRWL